MSNYRRYLVVTPFFPSDNNHVGSYIYDQVIALKSQSDYIVDVIKIVGLFSSEKNYSFNGIDVHIFKIIDLPFFIFPGLFNFINTRRFIKFLRRCSSYDDIKVLHGHVCYPSAYLINIFSRKKKIFTIIQHHGIDVLQLLNGRLSLITFLQQSYLKYRSIRKINSIGLNISVSKKVMNKLRGYKMYNPNDEYVLYNGVDTEKFYPIKSIKNSSNFEIGCVANFWPIKDHYSLIKAISLLIKDGITDIHLRLVGDGVTLNKCKDYVKDNNLQAFISFEKNRSHEELNQFYNEIDVMVLPSYFEALGCVLLESWATNTVVISIKGQGFSEIIPEKLKDKLLAEPNSPESLRDKLRLIYEKREDMIFDKNYDIKNTITNFLRYLNLGN